MPLGETEHHTLAIHTFIVAIINIKNLCWVQFTNHKCVVNTRDRHRGVPHQTVRVDTSTRLNEFENGVRNACRHAPDTVHTGPASTPL